MRYLVLALCFAGCGSNEPHLFNVNGESINCTVIEKEPCGLTLACEDKGFHQCYSN